MARGARRRRRRRRRQQRQREMRVARAGTAGLCNEADLTTAEPEDAAACRAVDLTRRVSSEERLSRRVGHNITIA